MSQPNPSDPSLEPRYLVIRDCRASATRPQWTPITRFLRDRDTADTCMRMEMKKKKNKGREFMLLTVSNVSHFTA